MLIKLGLTLVYVIANLPLAYIIWTQKEDIRAIVAIIGHAPNQFIFLSLVLPFILLATHRTSKIILSLGLHERIREYPAWKWGIGRRLVIILPLLGGLGIALAGTSSEQPDFYQLERGTVSDWAVKNAQILKNLNSHINLDEARVDSTALAEVYRNGKDHRDVTIGIFEFLELWIMLSMVGLMLGLAYLGLRILADARRFGDSELRDKITGKLWMLLPVGIITMISYLFWPALRSYNLFEIQYIFPEYSSIHPGYTYPFAFLFGGILVWIYYRRQGGKLGSVLAAIAGFLSSGILMSLSGLKPDSLIDFLGSGMDPGNLAVMVVLVILAGIFGHAILGSMDT